MINPNELKYDQNGLIPAIIQEEGTRKILMMAYMNRESLEISLEKKLTCFYSRSRQQLWLKGETSGNYQHIVSVSADCDLDTLLMTDRKDEPACNTGSDSCFFNPLLSSEAEETDFGLEDLYQLIQGRKTHKKEGSYTSYLFEKGLDKILKKVGEESTEVVIAGKGEDKGETVYEIADLCYHVMVLMVEMGIEPGDILKELRSRHVIDHKVKQEKMSAGS